MSEKSSEHHQANVHTCTAASQDSFIESNAFPMYDKVASKWQVFLATSSHTSRSRRALFRSHCKIRVFALAIYVSTFLKDNTPSTHVHLCKLFSCGIHYPFRPLIMRYFAWWRLDFRSPRNATSSWQHHLMFIPNSVRWHPY